MKIFIIAIYHLIWIIGLPCLLFYLMGDSPEEMNSVAFAFIFNIGTYMVLVVVYLVLLDKLINLLDKI